RPRVLSRALPRRRRDHRSGRARAARRSHPHRERVTGCGLPLGQGRAARLLRRPGDEADAGQGRPPHRQRAAAREAPRVRRQRGVSAWPVAGTPFPRPTKGEQMATWIWIVIIAAAVLVIAVIAWSAASRRRTSQLRGRFGPEYDRTVESADGRRSAERQLREREEHRRRLNIRPLTPESRDRYGEEWDRLQTPFVDDPSTSGGEAGRVVAGGRRGRA